MRIALIQIESGEDKEANFKKAKEYLAKAAEQKSDIVCLSENFLYRGSNMSKVAENLASRYISSFQELARFHNLNIILGSIALSTGTGERVTNSSLIIDRTGKIIHRYDKIYMYDVENADVSYRESDTTKPGDRPGIFELDGIKMGVGICVDLRYPEYFRELVKSGVKIIFLPSNFRKVTGKLAWEILTRSRAIENQAYFCACGQTGGLGALERCGNSRIISFDGSIISQLGEEEDVVIADIDFESLNKFRKEFPVLKQMK